ncbi:hypothetical protein GCM10027446_26230 [Angustibacter peucedani]
MLVLALVALAVLTVPLSGGRWAALGGVTLQRSWLLWVALALQVLAIEGPDLGWAAAVVHVVSYLLAGWFVWVNREVPGIWVIALGGLANGVTIALNGGTLPASAKALAAAGLSPGEGFVNSGVVHDPVLPWLGDVFAWPQPLPLANVFSVGDVLLVAGAFWAVHRLGRRRETLAA